MQHQISVDPYDGSLFSRLLGSKALATMLPEESCVRDLRDSDRGIPTLGSHSHSLTLSHPCGLEKTSCRATNSQWKKMSEKTRKAAETSQRHNHPFP